MLFCLAIVFYYCSKCKGKYKMQKDQNPAFLFFFFFFSETLFIWFSLKTLYNNHRKKYCIDVESLVESLMAFS